jgi:hypothetical protein
MKNKKKGRPTEDKLEAGFKYIGLPNDFNLIKLLLEAGSNPNAVDQYRRSPLHLLASKERFLFLFFGHPRITQLARRSSLRL